MSEETHPVVVGDLECPPVTERNTGIRAPPVTTECALPADTMATAELPKEPKSEEKEEDKPNPFAWLRW